MRFVDFRQGIHYNLDSQLAPTGELVEMVGGIAFNLSHTSRQNFARMADFDFPFTYSGVLDDVMAKYGPKMNTRAFFQRMIAKNVFFGGGIYINDGYLVNHPLARHYLANENSLLRAMLRYGFIKILTRENSAQKLAEMPHTMARARIDSFQKLVKSTEWRREFKKTWYALSDWAFEAENVKPWPNRNMSYGFCKLILRALNSDPADIGVSVPGIVLLRVCEDFFHQKPLEGGPRDRFEKAVITVLDDTPMSHRERLRAKSQLMGVANQAYHYNFGLCITHEIGARRTTTTKSGGAICVDTTFGKAFDELLLLEEGLDEYMLKQIPLFGIPKDYRFEKGDIFEPLVRAGSRAYSAKVRFAKEVQNIIVRRKKKGLTARYIKAKVEEVMMNYVNALRHELPFHVEEKAFFDTKGRLAVSQQPSVIADPQGQIVGSSNACLTHAISKGAKQSGMNFLVKKGVLSKKNRFTLHEVRPQMCSLLFDMKKADEFVSGIPSFKK